MFKNGKWVSKEEEEKKKKERQKKEERARKRRKRKREKRRQKERTMKNKEQEENKVNSSDFDEEGEEQQTNLDEGDESPNLDDKDDTPYSDILNNDEDEVPYPDITDNESEEEEEDGLVKQTVDKVKDIAAKAKKWVKRARRTSMIVAFIITHFWVILISTIIIGVLGFFILILASGGAVSVGDGDNNNEEKTEEKEDNNNNNEEKEDEGEGKLDSGDKKDFIKGHKDPSPEADVITSVFGKRESPGGVGSTDHGAWDMAPSGKDGKGLDIKSFQDGEVVDTTEGCEEGDQSCGGGYGNHIIIEHSDNYRTLYAHLSKVEVKDGDSLSAGDDIGKMGHTGSSTGAHLHFEVREKDGDDFEKVDPDDYFEDHDKDFL